MLSGQMSLEKFRSLFWDAFHRPALSSERFNRAWLSLEHFTNMLAGPFFSIYEKGNCDYFFEDKTRFPEINDPDDFLDWSVELVTAFRDAVMELPAETEEEIKDKQVLLFQADIMMELAGIGYDLIIDN